MERYEFRTRWLIQATAVEIARVLEDPLDLPRWWPSVYLQVRSEEKRFYLVTRSFLPYRLRWSFRVGEVKPPHRFSLEADGDLQGSGEWTLTELADSRTEVVYDWRVVARKPLLKLLSPLLRPVFVANHRWAMKRGERSLNLEVRRRRGEMVPDPPGPVRWWPAAALTITAVWLARTRR